VVGADPEGSIYSAGPDDEIHQYFVEGVGEDFYPETVDLDIIDRFIKVTDAESFAMTRGWPASRACWWGARAGMAAHAASRSPARTPRLVVVILPDSGRGYLSKVFNDQWMRDNGFGAVLDAEGA
jgi:cystathionine beta-synthase